MLQLVNITPFQAERAVQRDQDGNQIWVVVVKATYLINGQSELELHAEQEPVCLVPRYSGEPGKSSLLRECEAVFEHPGTDIILNATAHAPRRTPIQALDVVISVGQIQMTLRVFGDRYWKTGLYGPRATACTVWGDLFNRPVCGFVRLGNELEQTTRARSTVHAIANRSRVSIFARVL